MTEKMFASSDISSRAVQKIIIEPPFIPYREGGRDYTRIVKGRAVASDYTSLTLVRRRFLEVQNFYGPISYFSVDVLEECETIKGRFVRHLETITYDSEYFEKLAEYESWNSPVLTGIGLGEIVGETAAKLMTNILLSWQPPWLAKYFPQCSE